MRHAFILYTRQGRSTTGGKAPQLVTDKDHVTEGRKADARTPVTELQVNHLYFHTFQSMCIRINIWEDH